LGHKKWLAAIGRPLVPLDRALHRATGGRINLMSASGLPSLLLTTVGAKTGLPRQVPLLYASDGDAFIVTASNWGQAHHPAWSGNLLANPEATVQIGGRTIEVRADFAEGELRERLWGIVTKVWPAYDTYEARSGRDIRVFRLSPR
jgi:deazaflavin-dependent oxidoreductase (nitroreductase family)